MRWAGRSRVALLLGTALVAFAGAACIGGPPPPPPPPAPVACQNAGPANTPDGANEPARPPSDQPISREEAGAQAREVAATTEVRTKRGEIPLLTVEEQNGRPEITSTSVATPEEAASVAEAKASDGDLVGIDVDKPVRATTNDPRFGEQWSFTKVPFEGAWTTVGTGTGVTVAVVDTGVMGDHPDLSGQVLTGAHFLHSDDGEPVDPAIGGTEDFSGHGTHVAGTIAAKSNNATGVSGAAPDAQILPVKVLCADGGGFTSDVADGIMWAVDAGADVINLSLGGGATSGEEAAIAYARDNGVVAVAAGGNDGNGGPASYPAAYSDQYTNVIAVAATDNANNHPSYGTTGNYLDVAAPGGVDASGCNATVEILSTWNNGDYCAIAGTSMSTPHVSAAAALLRAANGACTAAQVKTRIRGTATDLGALGEDSTFGTGLINPVLAGTICP
jgi:subtilisin family serine protease